MSSGSSSGLSSNNGLKSNNPPISSNNSRRVPSTKKTASLGPPPRPPRANVPNNGNGYNSNHSSNTLARSPSAGSALTKTHLLSSSLDSQTSPKHTSINNSNGGGSGGGGSGYSTIKASAINVHGDADNNEKDGPNRSFKGVFNNFVSSMSGKFS